MVASGDRAALARAITLMESRRPDHREAARALLQELMPRTGKAVRIGITGVPGVGKSTTIDTLGSMLTEKGQECLTGSVDFRIMGNHGNGHRYRRRQGSCRCYGYQQAERTKEAQASFHFVASGRYKERPIRVALHTPIATSRSLHLPVLLQP